MYGQSGWRLSVGVAQSGRFHEIVSGRHSSYGAWLRPRPEASCEKNKEQPRVRVSSLPGEDSAKALGYPEQQTEYGSNRYRRTDKP